MVTMTDEKVHGIHVTEFGERLKQAREAANVTGADLAEWVGLEGGRESQGTISKWEGKRRGDRPGEVAKYLDKIEFYLGLPRGELHRAYEETFGRYGFGDGGGAHENDHVTVHEEDDAVALIRRIKAELSRLETLLGRS